MDAAIDLAKFHPQGSPQIYPVVLSGGAGTRLWPLSRTFFPKQFHSLASDRTLFQETVARNRTDTGFAAPIVVCNEEHRFMIDEQLRQLDITPSCVLLEPVARNTAPAIAVAAIWLMATDPDAVMLVQPSDHVIGAAGGLHEAVARGLAVAEIGRLVTFGVRPSRPETGFGYIQVGAPLDGTSDVLSVDRFVEKPDAQRAAQFIESGSFFWNSGIFLLGAARFLDELKQLHPTMFEMCAKAVADGVREPGLLRLDAKSFAEVPALSVDHAVMERTDKAAVVPVDMAWSDVGSWQALREISKPDQSGNVIHGDVITDDVRNCYIRADETLVAAVGVEDVVIVATDDAILVAKADAAAQVPRIVERLRARNRPEPTQHTTIYRPWGYFRAVDAGDRFQVKRLMVKPGAKLSLQMHFHRAEHWVVVHGTALVQRGQERMLLRENESIYIPSGTEHRLENPGKLPLHLIEVQSGAYLGEDDIVRIADTYGRS
jgi:mannose-1-phosphate guanylyltransferase/mannose-6-phosphate isomerase